MRVEVLTDLEEFKATSDMIVSNSMADKLTNITAA